MSKPSKSAAALHGLERHLQQGRAERSLLVDRAAIDEQARTATLAFASETPYERFWGVEILDVTPTSMRQGRLRSGANLLVDHNWSDVVGVIESVEIGADRVARAVVRFGKSARAEEVWQDVRDGIRRNVSVGYMVHKAQLVETVDGLETYRVTDWEPFEVSLVAVPADATVGVGRSAVEQGAQPEAIAQADTDLDVAEATPAPVPPTDPAAPVEARATATPKETTMTDVKVEERNHAAEISKIAATLPGGAELALSAIQRGLTVEQFQREAIEKLASKPLPTADVGLTDKEVRQFSVMNVIRALADGSQLQGFEREVSDAVAQKIGKASRGGYFLPAEVQRRDLVKGTASAGGNLVATDLLGGSFIDVFRNAMVLSGLGTRMMTGLVGNVAIPKQTGAATAYWVAENTAPTESQQSFGQVLMSPKTVGAYTDIGRTLMSQASVDVESIVLTDLATQVALAVQQAAISGSGASNQPSGLLTLITPSVIGGTNGAAPDWQDIIDLESNVAIANADVGSLAYLTNAKVRGKLKATSKVSGQNGFIWDGSDTPLNGYRAAVTNAVPGNLTKGTATAVCSAIVFGNFADLMIGMWGSTELIRDPYSGSTAGTVRIVALQDVDVAVRNVESFATMVDALTA